jgi:hypothetical protein
MGEEMGVWLVFYEVPERVSILPPVPLRTALHGQERPSSI